MSRINFLVETIQALESYDKFPKDVLWVGDEGACFTWEDFEEIGDFEYDNGFGGNEIMGSLMVVGEDFWMTRGEYDGSEWWDFHSYPDKPKTMIKPHNLKQTYFSYDDNKDFKEYHGELIMGNFNNDDEVIQHIRENNIKKVLD